ncbi:hypothetical protein Tco_0344034 [Tanacetum coccineum]
MSTDKESSAAGTDNRPPMLVESDYESWKIRIERYIRGKTLGKLIWRSIQNGPTPHPQITMTEGQGEDAVQVTRDKRDEEFTEIENNKELADIQATNILSQGLPRHVFNILNQTRTGKEIWDNVELLMKGLGKSLQQHKEELFDEYERFHAIGNESIHDYFVCFHKLINDMKITQLNIPTHQINTKFVNNLPLYWEQSTSIVDPLAYLAQTTHYQRPTQTTTPPPPQYGPLTSSTPQQVPQSSIPQSSNDAMTSSNSRSHATVHDGQIVTETVQRRALSNVGHTGNRGIQSYDQMTDNKGKKVICYNCRGEGHVARQSPYDQSLAITTTNMFEVSHEDAYDSEVDKGPHVAATFMANLSSISGTNGATTSQVNEVYTDANQIFCKVQYDFDVEMHQEEHLDSDVESDIDDNTIPYHQYQLDSEVQDVPTKVSSMPPGEISMITILNDLRTQLDGYLKVNQEQCLVNDSLRVKLARCKQEMVSLERNQVKHNLDQTIVQRNKQNADLEEENVLLKSRLSQNVESINSLKNASKKVVSEKSNLWNLKQAKLSQPTLYDGHALLNPTHTSVKVHDSEDSLVHAEVSRTKMSKRLGTIKPINYAELNALYSHFVPQKELFREQVYWLPAKELATQKSNPPKPVIPFVRTRPAKSQISTCLRGLNSWIPAFAHIFDELDTKKDICSIVLASDIVVPPSSNCLCEELRSNCDREHSKVVELEAEILKKQQMLIESEKHCAFIEKNHAKHSVNHTKKVWKATKNHNVNTTKTAWRPTGKVVGSVKTQWKPTGRHFALEHSKVIELEVEILKKQQMLHESEKRCAFIEKNHVNLQVKFQKYKECLQNQRVCDNSNSTASNAIFEINKLKDHLQGKDDTIRNLQTQINITRMLNVGSTVGSFDKHALETELTQLKDALTSV